MARKPSLKQAKAWAIRIYTLALKMAEKGDWQGAKRLTGGTDVDTCLFCRRHWKWEDDECSLCEVRHLCSVGSFRTRAANWNAGNVLSGTRTASHGLRHFRRTIQQLEQLEV